MSGTSIRPDPNTTGNVEKWPSRMDEMFRLQCQQTAHNTGCEGKIGVCGKESDATNFQDDLASALTSPPRAVMVKKATERPGELIPRELFTTITNVDLCNSTILRLIDQIDFEKEKILVRTENYDVRQV